MLIIYDLETTGLDTRTSNILEIACIVHIVNKNSDAICTTKKEDSINTCQINEFKRYIMPSNITTIDNSDIHNITIEKIKENNGKSTKETLNEFVNWMDKFKSPIILIAHNNYRYDKLILETEFKSNNVTFPQYCTFADSLAICKKCITDISNYKLGTIYEYLFGKSIVNAHSAYSDVLALKEIVDILVYHPHFKKCLYAEKSSFYFDINKDRLYYFRYKNTKYLVEDLISKNNILYFQINHLFYIKYGADDLSLIKSILNIP
jgi:DNA polymerase III alpha subunit (gram-positive type)